MLSHAIKVMLKNCHEQVFPLIVMIKSWISKVTQKNCDYKLCPVKYYAQKLCIVTSKNEIVVEIFFSKKIGKLRDYLFTEFYCSECSLIRSPDGEIRCFHCIAFGVVGKVRDYTISCSFFLTLYS
jgi:acetone carboxylase gamma subunit